MAKLLNMRDWILLTAAVSGEVFEETRNVSGLVPYLYKVRYGIVPNAFKKQSYLKGVSDLLKTKNIKKGVDKTGKTYIELTHIGKEKLKRRFPLFNKKKWDGSFMILIFDVPEENKYARDILRNKIKELGFGMLQESVWISPYHFEEDLNEFLDEHGYSDFVYVMNATKLLGQGIVKNADVIWKLDDLNSRYAEVVEMAMFSKSNKGKVQIKSIWKAYLDVLKDDPLLPEEFLPNDWRQKEARAALENIK